MSVEPTAPPSLVDPPAGPLAACPACGGSTIITVTDGEETNFVCDDCYRCWHVDLGWLHRVDPATCPGCLHKDRCRARLQEDDPDWWPPRSRH